MDIAGVRVPKGSVVVLQWGAANRDPAHFDNPDMIDMERKNAAQHLTFGYGAHTCVGNRLARAAIRIAIVKLLARMRNTRLANAEASVVRDPHFFAYGPREQIGRAHCRERVCAEVLTSGDAGTVKKKQENT